MAKKKNSVVSEEEIRKIILPDVYKSIKDVSEVSRLAIEQFYNDYNPEYYQRVFGLKNLFNISTEKISNGYSVKFIYEANNVTGKPHHGDYEWAFDTAFIHGSHGTDRPWGNKNPRNFVPVTIPSPWKRISDFVEHHYW